MTTSIAFFVDSPGARAHAMAASRLALGLAERGDVDTSLVCYSDDPAPSWLPPRIRVDRLGVGRASRAFPPLLGYLREQRPDVLIARQVHANFIALAAGLVARLMFRWRGRVILV